MTYFWRSIPDWSSMCKEPPNDTFTDSCLVPTIRNLLPLVKTLEKKIAKNILNYLILQDLGFTIERLAWATDR